MGRKLCSIINLSTVSERHILVYCRFSCRVFSVVLDDQQPRPQGSGLVSELPLCRYATEALKSPFAVTVPDFRAS